ncbi:MAG: hypothetical protein ACOC00_03475 [Halothiobacillaceae bacterium]
MKRRLQASLTVLALTALAQPVAAIDPDPREPIYLEPEQAEYVRGVMRLFLESLQGMQLGIAEEDWEAVARHARAAGSAAANDDPPPGMGAAFSDQWRTWGPATHGGFDEIALEAETLPDSAALIRRTGEVMKNCVACHAVHRIEVIDPLDRLDMME